MASPFPIKSKQRYTRLIAVIAAGFISSCATGQFEEGGKLDDQGWPDRSQKQSSDGTKAHTNITKRLRCPDNTDLVDEHLSDGGRRVACVNGSNPIPKGFEVVWYDNGQVSRLFSTTSKGEPIKRTQWFRDGQEMTQEAFRDGAVVERSAWYSTGAAKSETAYVNGRTTVQKWQPDGSIDAAGELVDGRKVGTWIEWLEGAHETRIYKNGVPDGDVSRTYVDNSRETGRYTNGVRNGIWSRVDRLNTVMYEQTYKNGKLHGPTRFYFPNRQVRSAGDYTDGKRNSVWTVFHPNGRKRAEETYVCDKEEGAWTGWFSTGTIEFKRFYNDGKPAGEWIQKNQSGNTTKVDSYGIPVSAIETFPSTCEN